VAAKHDGKHARANMWVTHQNLARAKGGRPGYQFQERKLPRPAKVAAAIPGAEPAAAPASELSRAPAVPEGKAASRAFPADSAGD
jgi:hypothetical protein